MKALLVISVLVAAAAPQISVAQEIVVTSVRRGPVAAIQSTSTGVAVRKVLLSKNLNVQDGRLWITDGVIDEDTSFQLEKKTQSVEIDLQKGSIKISGLYKTNADSTDLSDLSDMKPAQQAFEKDLIQNGMFLDYSMTNCSSVAVGNELFVLCRNSLRSMSNSHHVDLRGKLPKNSDLSSDGQILMSFTVSRLANAQPDALKSLAGRTQIEFKSYDDQSADSLPEQTKQILRRAGLVNDETSLISELRFDGKSIER